MAAANDVTGVRLHERLLHTDLAPIGENKRRIVIVHLNVTEDVVPPPAVEPGRVIPELIQNFLGLKNGRQGLNEAGGLHRPNRKTHGALSADKNIIPNSRLKVTLHLRQVEVGGGTSGDELASIMEKVEAKVDQHTRHGATINLEIDLIQMISPGTDKEDCGLLIEPIVLLGSLKADCSPHGVPQVNLAVNDIGPGGRGGVLQVGHEDPGSGVQGVNDHLPIRRPGDLNPAIHQVGRQWGTPPLTLPNRTCLGEKVQFGPSAAPGSI